MEFENKHDVELEKNNVDDYDHYYTFRVDNVDSQKIDAFFTKYNAEYKKVWIFDEISDKVEKQHMQGVVVITIEDEDERSKIERKHRMRIQQFFKKKGKESSFARVDDVERYITYIVKQGKQVICLGFDKETQQYYKDRQQESTAQYEAKKIRQRNTEKTKTPMQLIYEWYEDFYKQEYENAKKRQVDQNFDHESFLDSFALDRHIAKYMMIWWGQHAHKSFMVNKMAEAASYVKYNIYNKYSDTHLSEMHDVGSRNIVERMLF